MYKLDKLLVSLDLTRMDDLLIRYSSFLAKLLDVKKVYFVHVMEQHDVPEDIKDLYPDLDEPLESLIQEELKKKVTKFFDDELSVEKEVKVLDGGVSDTLMEWAKSEQMDLILLGKKTGFKGKGILSGRVVRLAHCSVMFVPETVSFQINKILAPIDLSSYSKMALEEAVKIADKTGAEIVCQHVYTIPKQYYPYIPSEKNVRKKVGGKAQKACERFVEKVVGKRMQVNCLSTFDPESDVGQIIYDQAIADQADLIVIGSKGRTNAASVLLGSTAEKLTSYEKSLPILIIKDKDENLGFLNALFGRKR